MDRAFRPAIVVMAMLCASLMVALCGEALSQIRSPLLRRRGEQLAPPPVFDRATQEVFFSNALEHLGPRASTLPAEPSQPAASVAVQMSNTADGSSAWASVISSESLEDEVKRLSPLVDEHVKSLAHFRSSGYRQARRDFSHLAALFGIVAEYDQPVRWKEQAASLRDAFGRAGQNCKAGSDASFREAQARAQDLRDLIRGGRPGVSGSEPEAWADAIDRAPLMLAMEAVCNDRIEPALVDTRQWTRSRDQVAHEAELLAALARIIQREGYEYADDETFQKHAQALEQACQQLVGAARDAELEQARQAFAAIRKSCEQCHVDYRG